MRSELSQVTDYSKIRSSGESLARVTVFKSIGQYPAGTYKTERGVYFASDECVFTVTKNLDWHELDPGLPYSEFDSLSPDELRLLGALILSERSNGPLFMFYPIKRVTPRFDRQYEIGKAEEIVAAIRNDFRGKNILWPPTGPATRPYILQRPESIISKKEVNLDRFQLIYEKLEPTNYVAMRAIYALIKSDMLSRYDEFWDDALNSLFIALDAIFTLVCRQLNAAGLVNPTANDAAKWLHINFDANFGRAPPTELDRFFEEFYDGRVATFHPASRHGDAPIPPTMHDDVTFLRRSLRDVLAFLVSREHDPEFLKEVEIHEKRKVKGIRE